MPGNRPEWVQERIREFAAEARRRIKGGLLFGCELSVDDAEDVIAGMQALTVIHGPSCHICGACACRNCVAERDRHA